MVTIPQQDQDQDLTWGWGWRLYLGKRKLRL